MENPIKRKQLYDYLANEEMTDLDYDSFSQEYATNSTKQELLYNYLKENDMTDLKYSDFSQEYFGDLSKTVKKKDNPNEIGTITLSDSELGISEQREDGSSASLERPENKTPRDRRQQAISNNYPTTPPKGLRLPQEDEFNAAQQQGVAPPSSELRYSKEDTESLYDMDSSGNPIEPKDEEFKVDFYNTSGNINTDEFNTKINQEIDEKIKEKDLDIPKPFLFYHNQQSVKDDFVNQTFGAEKIQQLGIDPKDFDGFLIKNGLKSDFKDRQERGLYENQSVDFSGNKVGELGYEIEKFRMLSAYMSEMDNRFRDRSVLEQGKQDPTAYAEGKIKRPNNTTIWSSEAVKEYMQTETPLLYQTGIEIDKKNKEILEKHKNGEAGWFYGGQQSLNSGVNALIDRATGFAATGYEFIGAKDTADQLRMLGMTEKFTRPNTREVVSVSGKVVDHHGERLIVDERGQIYDAEKKILVTDTFNKFGEIESILQKAKESKETDWIFSPQGAIMQASGVTADLLFQIALTRGVGGALGAGMRGAQIGEIGLSVRTLSAIENLGGAAIAQSAMGYSSGLEDALEVAREQGLTEKDSKRLANDVATRMAIVYGLTSFLSPQTKAVEGIFGSGKKELIRKAFKEFAKKGEVAYEKSILESLKVVGNKLGRAGVDFLEEGGKEVIQENIQQSIETYSVNPMINRGIGAEVRQTEMTKDDYINTSILSFFSSGLMSQSKHVRSFMQNTPDRLTMVKKLSDDINDFEKSITPLIENNTISSEFADELRKDVNNFKKQAGKVPQNMNPEIALAVMDDLQTIDDLQAKKKELDPAFHKEYDAQIAERRKAIEQKQEFSNLTRQQQLESKDKAAREIQAEYEAQGITDYNITDRELTNRAIANIQVESQQETATTNNDTKSDNAFNPQESEGEALARLSEQLEGLEGAEREAKADEIAKEHAQSYFDYVETQDGKEQIKETDRYKNFEQNAKEELLKDNLADETQERTAENGSRVDENGNPISETEFLESQEEIVPIEDEVSPTIELTPTNTQPTIDAETQTEATQETEENTEQEVLPTENETEQVTEPTVSSNSEVLNEVNPTGGVFVEYSAEQRDKMPLGENIVTYDKTSGKDPDEFITVYRGVPKEVNEINSGDFVTTNEQLAKDYAGTGKVISKQVKSNEILDDKTEPLGEEYILRERPTQLEENTNQQPQAVSESEGQTTQVAETPKPRKERIRVPDVKNAEFDVTFDDNGNVTKIESTKGTEVKKFIERKVKPSKKNPKGIAIVRNGNYSAIEAQATNTITENKAKTEEDNARNEAVRNFNPTNEYEYALDAIARGNKVSLESAQKETGLSAKEVRWATDNKTTKSIEGLAEDIVGNSEQELDLQDVRQALIDIIKDNESVLNSQNEILESFSENQKALEAQEMHEFMGRLSEKERSLIEDAMAEDSYLEQLTETEKQEYYEEQYQNPENRLDEKVQRTDTEPTVSDTSVQESKPTESKEINLSEDLGINDFLKNLDSLSDQLDQFGKETLGINFPVAVGKLAIDAMKLAGKTAKTTADIISAGLNAVQNSDWYKRLSDNKKADIDANFIDYLNKPFKDEPINRKKPNKTISQLEKVIESKNRVIKKLRDRRAEVKDLSREITKYINSVIDTGLVRDANARQIQGLLASVRDTHTKHTLSQAFNKVNRIVAEIDNKRTAKSIQDLIKNPKQYLEKKNGRNKAKKIDNETRKIIKHLSDWQNRPSDEIHKELNLLNSDLQNVDLSLLTALNIALEISEAREAETRYKANNNLGAIENALRKNTNILQELDALIDEGKSRLKEQVRKEAERLREIQEKAIESTTHKDSGKTNLQKQQERFRKKIKWFSDFTKDKTGLQDINLAKATTFTFEYLLGYVDRVYEQGKGFLYQKFYSGEEGLLQKDNNYRRDAENIRKDIKKAIDNIFGKKLNTIITDHFRTKKINKIRNTGIIITNEDGVKDMLPLSYAQALYVHLVSKMDAQNEQLRNQGWDDTSFEQLETFLGKEYLEMSDFMTNYLESKYSKYNETHLEIMRTDLGFEEGYFPTKYEDVDLSYEFNVGETPFTLASVMSRNMIEKVKNNNRIDLTQNAFEVFNQYLESMETFHHYARFIKDLNAVLNNKNVKNNIKGYDPRAYSDLIKLSKAVVGDKSDFQVSNVEKNIYGWNAAIASGYIVYKGWTALKQFLSMPAYTEFADMFVVGGKQIPLFHKTYFMTKMALNMNPYHIVQNYRFLHKNSQSFRDRMKNGNLGDEFIKTLLNNKKSGNLVNKLFAYFVQKGISPNKLIDALTISTGGKVYFDQQFSKYKKNGMSETKAKEQAIRDFEIGFKITQQSSDIANLADVQIRKGALTAIFIPFKNAQMGYFRRIMANKNNILRRFSLEKQNAINNGLTPTQAGVKALQKVSTDANSWNELSNILLYTHVLPLIWQYVASGLPGIMSEWDDEDEAEMKRALALGPVDGLFIVNDISNFMYNKIVLKKPWKYQESIIIDEFQKTLSELDKASKDAGYFNEDVLMEIGKGYLKTKSIQLPTYENIYKGVEGLIINNETTTAEDILKILNAPKTLLPEKKNSNQRTYKKRETKTREYKKRETKTRGQ